MSDNEIVKALECCIEDDCDNCPYDEQTACKECLLQDAVNEINSLQIENETVKALNGRLVVLADRFRSELKTAKTEAYKEFAERVKEQMLHDYYDPILIDRILEALVGEMLND